MKLKNPFRKRYRVVRDNYLGYEVQVWKWGRGWLCPEYNTHFSLERAIEYLKRLKNPVVYVEED